MFDMLALAALIAIAVGSLTPLPQLPDVPSNDKLLHFVAYGTLAFLVAFHRQSLRSVVLVTIAVMLFGGLIELVQPFTNRIMSLGDMLANMAGAGLGACAVLVLKRYIFPINGDI